MQLIDLIRQVESNNDLDQNQSSWLMGQIMDGNLDPDLVKKLILALKAKGEAASEVIGFVSAMMQRTTPVQIEQTTLDIVGTGGDQLGSVNISSTAAIIAAAAGAVVVKHGNRAASSKSGSADVLEALGIKLNLSAAQVADCVAEVGIGFCFAPQFHPAMKNVAPIRKEIGVPTIFNILGPLANPAQPKAMLVGVADPARAELMADVLQQRGTSGFIARGDDGLDEITITTTSTLWQFGDQKLSQTNFDPIHYGLNYHPMDNLLGGDAAENAEFLIQTLTPSNNSTKIEAIRSAAILNAGAGLISYWLASGQISGEVSERDWHRAVTETTTAVSSGSALEKLVKWQQFCAAIN